MERASRNAVLCGACLLAFCTLALLPSCSTFRPMPTHGGGKRFDEEQRLVSAAAQHTAGRIEYSRIRRSKVAVEITSPDTSGSLAERYDWKDNSKVTPTPPRYPGIQTLFHYRVNPWLQNAPTVTSQDVVFLEKCVESQLRSRNYQVVGRDKADVHMVVLVDCLGTNQARNDLGLAFRDQLKVTCAITWYVIDARTQEVLVPAKSLVSQGVYQELNLRGSPWDSKKRDLGIVTEEDKLMLNPKAQAVASGPRGSAPVAALQQEIPKSMRKSGGSSPDIRFLDLPVDHLPGAGMPGDPPSDLLPPLEEPQMDNQAPAADDLTKLPMGDLIRRAWDRSKNKDIPGMKAAIGEIRSRKPDAQSLEKLDQRLEQLEQKQKQP